MKFFFYIWFQLLVKCSKHNNIKQLQFKDVNKENMTTELELHNIYNVKPNKYKFISNKSNDSKKSAAPILDETHKHKILNNVSFNEKSSHNTKSKTNDVSLKDRIREKKNKLLLKNTVKKPKSYDFSDLIVFLCAILSFIFMILYAYDKSGFYYYPLTISMVIMFTMSVLRDFNSYSSNT